MDKKIKGFFKTVFHPPPRTPDFNVDMLWRRACLVLRFDLSLRRGVPKLLQQLESGVRGKGCAECPLVFLSIYGVCGMLDFWRFAKLTYPADMTVDNAGQILANARAALEDVRCELAGRTNEQLLNK